jgi:hypothetical protein
MATRTSVIPNSERWIRNPYKWQIDRRVKKSPAIAGLAIWSSQGLWRVEFVGLWSERHERSEAQHQGDKCAEE